MKHLIRILFALVVLALAVPLVGLGGFYAAGPSPQTRVDRLLAAQEAAWTDPARREATIASLRRGNPEWDLMWRTFTVLSVLDVAVERPEQEDRWLALADDIIADTIAQEAHGHGHFLLGYATFGPWRDPARRSVFVDGEIALMLGARRLVRDDPAVAALHRERVALVERAFDAAPRGLPESYPNEVWLFCVTNALVSLRMQDVLDGTDHNPTIDRFVAQARTELVDPASGLLGSEFTADAGALDGTEGSSVWLVATNLLLLDEPLARRQYEGATAALGHSLLGLGWANEWGAGWGGVVDIDSGPIVPVLGASPSSSGFALVASRAFGDARRHRPFVRGLRAADLLLVADPRLAAMAEAPMGDAIILHGLTAGPVWDRVRARTAGRTAL